MIVYYKCTTIQWNLSFYLNKLFGTCFDMTSKFRSGESIVQTFEFSHLFTNVARSDGMSFDHIVGVTTHTVVRYYFCVVCNSIRAPLKYNSDFIKYSMLIGLFSENSFSNKELCINMITDVIVVTHCSLRPTVLFRSIVI